MSENNHHKRQDFLLDSFKHLTELHTDGWELHFAGSVAEDVGGLKYILELIKSASGYPVAFHFNSSFEEMKMLYSKASIYWHATGYGVSSKKFPEKQEHFGISTVEAMSARSIPIVINTAGQKESVEQGVNGFLWDRQEDLISQTKAVVSMSANNTEHMRKLARMRAKNWNIQAFRISVLDTFQEFLK